MKRRWRRHKCGLRNNKHENIILQRAWNKYGEENFIFEIIQTCDEERLLMYEQKYLDLKSKYNVGTTASGGDILSNHPNREEIIAKIKLTINKRIKLMTDDERNRKYSRPREKNPNWNGGSSFKYCECGKMITPINNYCINCIPRSGNDNPFYGKKHSDEVKKHLSEVNKGKYRGSQNIMFEIDGIKYKSLGEASKILGIPTTTIRWRLKSNNEKYKNYKYN